MFVDLPDIKGFTPEGAILHESGELFVNWLYTRVFTSKIAFLCPVINYKTYCYKDLHAPRIKPSCKTQTQKRFIAFSSKWSYLLFLHIAILFKF